MSDESKNKETSDPVNSGVAEVSKKRKKRKFTEADFWCTDKERFQLELEFVQCLACPQYIHWLAQNQWFEDPAFLKYLKYLRYWKRPKYAKYIVYPHTFYFLDMIQNKDFQKAMARDAVKETVHAQQFFFWQHYRQNRMKDDEKESDKEEALMISKDKDGGKAGGGEGMPVETSAKMDG
ncbi:hypothetical protein BSKO_11427 [Bryopsis sp. KO-2023]|nr:hypothetical protein BSKO_11427 [Bryopsis sp. KO-2023]